MKRPTKKYTPTLQELLEEVVDAAKYAIKHGYTKDEVEFFELAAKAFSAKSKRAG